MRIPRPAAEKLGVDRQDPDLDGLLLGLIRRATGGCHEHAARLDPMYGIGKGRGFNAPEGCQHGTHTNGTAYTRGTYSRVHTQTQTNAQRGPTKYGAGSRRGAALLIRGGRLAPTPSELQLCRDLPRRSYVHRHGEALGLQREPRRRRPAHFVLVLPLG